ncbi:MAG TPA: sulfotransferase [Kiritimatiellia bacterium]|nr:sulfotransferase [Kiritimatiellia bacterium]
MDLETAEDHQAGMPRRVLPNFLIAGAAKCGTTSLYYHAKQHPDVFMCSPKEPDFFFAQFSKIPTNGIGDDCQSVVRDYDEYCRLFEDAAGKAAIGDASHTNLYYHQKTIPLIKQYLGDPKIVIILRNPVERAFSTHTALTLQGREFLPFEEALREEPKRIKEGWRSTWAYQTLGFYTHQVKAFLDHFSAVKVCLFDDLKREPVSLIQDIYRFLGVDPSFTPDTTANFNLSGVPRHRIFKSLFRRQPTPLQRVARHVGRAIFTEDGWASVRERLKAKLLVKSTMKPETRRHLQDVYRDDIAALQKLIGRDLSTWLADR